MFVSMYDSYYIGYISHRTRWLMNVEWDCFLFERKCKDYERKFRNIETEEFKLWKKKFKLWALQFRHSVIIMRLKSKNFIMVNTGFISQNNKIKRDEKSINVLL